MSLSRRAVLLSGRGKRAREPYAEFTLDEQGRIVGVSFYGTEAPQFAFSGNGYGMLTTATVAEGCEYLGSGAFSASGLTSISLPSTLEEIGSQAFQNCILLTSITLPSGLDYLGRYAFRSCTALESVTFTGTPSSIAANIFAGCTELRNIYVPWAEGAVAGAPWGATNATVHYESL